MGDVLHPQAGAGDVAALWPGELDEQLITELLSDDSLLLLGAPQQQPAAGDSSEPCCSRDDTGASPPAVPAPCNSGAGEQEAVPQPEAVSRALCSVYTGPTIRDIEKALSTSRPYPWSTRRYSPMHLFGAAIRAPESKYTTKVRSCGGKTPSDGYKWRKYGQKSIKNNPHPRCSTIQNELLQVHELPVRREEARGEVHGRPGDADRHIRRPAPAWPAAALPAPPVGVRRPVRRRRRHEEAGRNPVPDRARKRRRGRRVVVVASERRPPTDDVRRRRGSARRARCERRRRRRAAWKRAAAGGDRGLVRRRLDRLRAGAAGCYRDGLRVAAYDLVVP
ncbi:unnamed protein product [Urochloa humidicola]